MKRLYTAVFFFALVVMAAVTLVSCKKRTTAPSEILSRYIPASTGSRIEILSMKSAKAAWDREYYFHLKHSAETFDAVLLNKMSRADKTDEDLTKQAFVDKFVGLNASKIAEVYRGDTKECNIYVAVSRDHGESWLQIGIP